MADTPQPAPDGAVEWITTPVAAQLLGITINTVRALIASGELPAEIHQGDQRPKMRRLIRIRRSEVDAYIERSRLKPGDLRHLYP
jgi:excisionase family DNA binding protein